MHSIRLRGPWELCLPSSEEPRRVEMPATWQTLLAAIGDSPAARLVRRFGKPTGIEPTDRLSLIIESAAAACRIEFNGELLGSIDPSQQSSSFEVTTLLAGRNELAILLDFCRQDSELTPTLAPLRDVRLEISQPPE